MFRREWDRVDLFEVVGASSDDQIPPCQINPHGKIGEGDIPRGGDATRVLLPQISSSASQFQNLCVGWKFQQMIEDPIHPAVRIRAEALMDRHARVEVR